MLTGERAQHDIETGDRESPWLLTADLLASSWGVGLVPEQGWENPALLAGTFGSDPTTASIGFINGEAARSAMPLTCAHAQLVRLLVGPAQNSVIEQPAEVRARYVDNAVPAVPSP